MKRTIYCQLQNRLGALDKVISTLSLFGFLTEELIVSHDPKFDRQNLIMTFVCDDDAAMTRLIKAFERQIYVIEAYQIDEPEAAANDDLQRMIDAKRSKEYASNA
jgi:acetolactate synthase small subunit